jgi:hypothetical protein
MLILKCVEQLAMVGSQGASRRMFYWVVATRHEGTTLRQSVVLLYLFCVAQYILFKYYMLIRPWYLLVIPWLAFPLFSFPCAGLIEKCWCDVSEFPFSCVFCYLYQRFMSGHLSCLLCETIGFHIFPLTFLYWVLSSLFNWASGCRLSFCMVSTI